MGAPPGAERPRPHPARQPGQTQVWATPELLAGLTDRSGRGPTRDQTPGPAEAWPPDELAALREELGESRELAARTAGELAAEQRRNAELVETLTAALARAEARADRLEASWRGAAAVAGAGARGGEAQGLSQGR